MAKKKGSAKSGGGNKPAAKSNAKRPQGQSAKGGSQAAATASEGMSTAQKVSWWSLVAAVFVVPVVISNWTWLGFDLPLTFDQFDIIKVFFQRAFALVALGGWAWHMFTKGGKLRSTPVEWLILAFLAWVAISAVFSIHPPTAIFGKYRRFEGLISFITYAIFFFLVLQFADRPSRVKQLAQSLFWSSIIVAGYGTLQYLGLDFVRWSALPFEERRAFSTYGNPDLLGGFLMFSMPIALALALSEKRTMWRAIYWFGFFLNAFVWIVAFTRSAWVGGVVGLVVLGVIIWRQRPAFQPVDYGFGVATVAAGGVAIFRSLSSQDDVMNFGKRVASIVDFDAGSAETRFQIWDAAWRAVKDRPIFGFGADTFRLVFPGYKPVEYTQTAGYLSVADNVHNYPLQLAAGIGIPGMLMLYGIFAWSAVLSAPTIFKRADDGSGPYRLLLGGFWAACAGYIAHLLFGLSVTGVSFLLWIALAVVLAPVARAREIRPPSWGTIAAVAIAVVTAVLFVMNVIYLRADNRYLVARLGQGEARIEAAQDAIRLNPWNDMYRAELGVAITDARLVPALQQLSQVESQGGDTTQYAQLARQAFEDAEAAYLETIEFVPPEYDNYNFLADLYFFGGTYLDPALYEETVVIARKGVEVEEYGPAVRYQLARGLLETGRADEAAEELEAAVEMDEAFADGVLLLAAIYEEQGRPEDAIPLLEAAAEHPRIYILNPSLEQQLRARIAEIQGAEATESPDAADAP